MEVAVSCFNAQRQRKKSHAPFEIDFDTSLYFQQQQSKSIYLIIITITKLSNLIGSQLP